MGLAYYHKKKLKKKEKNRELLKEMKAINQKMNKMLGCLSLLSNEGFLRDLWFFLNHLIKKNSLKLSLD